MPTYDYQCGTCDYRFELKQSFSSKPIAPCPKCRKNAARQFHAVPIVFKGSGWYVNDYGKSGSKSDSASEPKDSSKTTSKSESKKPSSSKSESKSDTEVKSKAKAGSATGEAKGD